MLKRVNIDEKIQRCEERPSDDGARFREMPRAHFEELYNDDTRECDGV